MVLRPLPKSLIKRVRKAAGKKPESIRDFVSKLKNIDHRAEEVGEIFSRLPSIDMPGGRVYSMNVSRTYPRLREVVIKRTHGSRARDLTSAQVVKILRKSVSNHNKRFGTKDYYLLKPIAYPFGKEYVLMSKVNKFSISQVISSAIQIGLPPNFYSNGSSQKFILGLSKKTKKPVDLLVFELGRASKLLMKRIENIESDSNFLVVGYKNGKFIFVPLVDLF
jgi:hypothetical protein